MNTNGLVLAQFGCGYWGPNLLRNFSALPKVSVKYVVDASPERRNLFHNIFPKTIALENTEEVLNDPRVNGIVIATPATTHFELAKRSLDAGKHVFVEKPLATKATEVDKLGG